MAHRAHHSANHLAQSSTHATDYHSQDNDSQTSANGDFHCENNDSHASHSYPATPITAAAQTPLRIHVERMVREYFAALGDEVPTDLYELILKEVELPLLTVVLEQTRGNQTKCAQILGLNRGTLRKKMKTYQLM